MTEIHIYLFIHLVHVFSMDDKHKSMIHVRYWEFVSGSSWLDDSMLILQIHLICSHKHDLPDTSCNIRYSTGLFIRSQMYKYKYTDAVSKSLTKSHVVAKYIWHVMCDLPYPVIPESMPSCLIDLIYIFIRKKIFWQRTLIYS